MGNVDAFDTIFFWISSVDMFFVHIEWRMHWPSTVDQISLINSVELLMSVDDANCLPLTRMFTIHVSCFWSGIFCWTYNVFA